MPTEGKNPEIKGTKDEIISVTDITEKEVVNIDEDLSEVEAFTQEEMDVYPTDHEGQFIQLIFLFDLTDLIG